MDGGAGTDGLRLAGIDLNKLHTFVAIADHGGVSAAARQLALTPSAVSQSLSALESSLGLLLFNRVGRRLVPTPPGRDLHARLREHFAGLQESLARAVADELEVRGQVRVGLSLGFPRVRLAELLREFSEAEPGVQVRLAYGSRAELDEMLLSGRTELVLSFDPGEARGRIRPTRLFRQELVLVGAREAWMRRFSFSRLSELPVVDYYQSDPLIARWVRHHYRRRPPRLDVRSWAATTDLVLELVRLGVGVGVLPTAVVSDDLAAHTLFAARTNRRELSDRMWLRELAGGWLSPAARRFRSAALAAFSGG